MAETAEMAEMVGTRAARYRPLMQDWAPIAIAVAILAIIAVREVLRWRGRRWRRSGPRGNDRPDPPSPPYPLD